MAYKLPPLSVFISEAQKQFDIAAKLGMTGDVTWETHVRFIKATYKDMQAMDPVKLEQFMEARSRQRRAMLEPLKTELDKVIGVIDARNRLEEAAKQAGPKKRDSRR